MSGYRIKELPISTDLAFRLLEALRLTPFYLDPPDDWKPWKFDDPEEQAQVLVGLWRELFAEMQQTLSETEEE